MKYLLTLLLAFAPLMLAQEAKNFRVSLGDSTPLSVPLTWQGAEFAPGGDWALIFTAKTKAADADVDAVIQKASGAGITASATTAVISLVPADTSALDAKTLVWDVQAQNATTGEVRTVARGTLTLDRDVTRASTTSIPVVTTEEPVPFAVGASSFAALTDKTTVDLPGINTPLASALAGKLSTATAATTYVALNAENDFLQTNIFNADTLFGGVIFANGGLQSVGTIIATGFQGSGSGLVSLPASGLVGDVARARINTALAGSAATVAVTTLTGSEITTPAAPAANGWVIYADDSGGKTRLMVRFGSGAVQQIAIQP